MKLPASVLVILRIMRFPRAGLTASLLALASPAAHAAEPEPAKLEYERALTQYAAGDVAASLASMRESLRLSSRWELLYNVARLEQETGDCLAAISHYREYLERVPHGQLRGAAEAESAKLAESCPPQEPAHVSELSFPTPAPVEDAPGNPPTVAPGPTVAPSPAETRMERRAETLTPAQARSNPYGWLGWSAIAAGALSGAGAVYFTVQTHDAREQWNRSASLQVAGGPRADLALVDEEVRNRRWAQGLGVASGVLVAGGVLLLLFGGRGSESPASAPLTARVWVSPGHASATFLRTF